MKVLYYTSNTKKLDSPRRVLGPLGIRIDQVKVELPELQAKDATGVAQYKLASARRECDNDPIMVNDGSFHIDALEDWPHAHFKWAIQSLGVSGFLRVTSHLEGERERSCHFVHVMAYHEPGMSDAKMFVRRETGTLARESRGTNASMSELWKLYIPDEGNPHKRTLAEMNPEELARFRSQPAIEGVYRELGSWIAENSAFYRRAKELEAQKASTK